MLSGKEKRALRAEGNRLSAEVRIGKEGVTAGSLQNISNSFNTKELVKVKLLETCLEDKTSVSEKLADALTAEVVQILGNTILLYREFPDDRSK